MPLCAFGENLDEKHERDAAFHDDRRFWFLRWRQKIKPLMAFSHRCPKGIAFGLVPPFIFARKWREFPVILFAMKGKGPYRYENTNGHQTLASGKATKYEGFYLARTQRWTRWSVQLMWPLFFAAHWYKRESDVIPMGAYGQRDHRMYYFYIGAKRDGDEIFWMPALHVGTGWK